MLSLKQQVRQKKRLQEIKQAIDFQITLAINRLFYCPQTRPNLKLKQRIRVAS